MCTSENSTHPTNSTNHGNAPVAVPQVKVKDVAFAWHTLILELASVAFVQIVYCSNSHSYCRSHNLEDDEEEDIMQPSLVEREESEFFENSRHNYHPDQRIDDEPMLENFNTSLRYLKQDMHWTKRISSTTKILIVLLLFMCIAGAIMVGCNIQVSYWGGGDRWQWIDYLYFLSFIKLGISVVKYIPQAILNYQRKSTSGFQIWNILLDFSGGSLSIIQLIGDSLSEAKAQGFGGWTGILGNPAKFGLGLISIFFDIIFIIQHYVLYRQPTAVHQVMGEAHYSVATTKHRY